jgi:MFS family permease
MLPVMRTTWPLFLGLALIMVGYGLQNILLGLRAGEEGFSTLITGVIMSAFYGGFLAGSQLVPRMIANVGHVRVFAALASLASTVVLLHALLVEPVTWAAMRLVGGFTMAGLYVVAESWLNDRATNDTRGQILAIYMVVCLGGISLGQFLANAADISGFELFMFVSILLSVALVPMLLTARGAPEFGVTGKVGISELYRTSPLGVIGTLGCGMSHATLLSIAPVYAGKAGLSVAQVSTFTAAIFLGAMIFQTLIARISDRFDRRLVLTLTTLMAAAAAAIAIAISNFSTGTAQFYGLVAIGAMVGGLVMPIYSVCIAHTNDFLRQDQMVAASGTIYLIFGIGSVVGPSAATGVMEVVGPAGFFTFIGLVHAAIGLFAMWRMTQRKARPVEEQGPSVFVSAASTQVASTMVEEEWAESIQETQDHQEEDDDEADSGQRGTLPVTGQG